MYAKFQRMYLDTK